MVNGVETTIERVNGGLCAVLCPAGDSTIVFTYKTPGFAPACAVSLAACGVWAVYAGLCVSKRRKRRTQEEDAAALLPTGEADTTPQNNEEE
jgi:uncharacterized membrane protein YfhO